MHIREKSIFAAIFFSIKYYSVTLSSLSKRVLYSIYMVTQTTRSHLCFFHKMLEYAHILRYDGEKQY